MKNWLVVVVLMLSIVVVGQQKKHSTGGILTAATTPHSTTLSWTLGTVTGGTGTITATKIYAATTPGGETLANPLATITAPTANYTDTAVVAGGTKYYRASSVCPLCSPTESAMGPEFGPAVTPQDPGQPAPPTGLTGVPQ